MKSAGKIIGISALVVVVLLLAAGGVLWVLFPPEKVKTIVISEVEKALGRKVVVVKASISIYPLLGVSLSGLEISNTTRAGYSQGPFVTVDNLFVSVRLLSILKKQPQISGIVLKKPKIILETDSTGSFNYEDFAFLAKSANDKKTVGSKDKNSSNGLPALAMPVALDKFAIENGEITFIDRKNKQTIEVGSINQTIKSSLDKKLQDITTSGDLVLSNVSIKTKEISKPLSNLTIHLSHDVGADLTSGKVIVRKVELSLQKVALTMSGTVNNVMTDPDYDLKINSDDINIKDLLNEIPTELVPELAKLDASGTAKVDLAVTGVFAKEKPLPIKGTVTFTNGLIKYKDLPKALSNITTRISFTDNSADIYETKLRFGDNPIEFKANIVNFSKPQIDLSMSASINLLDVKDLITLPAGASLGGKIQTSFTAKGEVDPSDPEKLDVSGVANLKDVAVLWPPLAKPAIINGAFTLSSKAIGENLSVVTGQSSMKMAASVDNYLSLLLGGNGRTVPRPSAEFSISSPMINVDEILPPSDDKKTETTGTSNAGTKSGEEVPVIAPPPGIDLEGTITADKILYKGVTMNSLSVKVKARNDISDVSIKTGYSGGTIADNIHADLRNIKNVSFTNNITLSNIEINDLMLCASGFIKPANPLYREIVNLKDNLYGRINGTSTISGHGMTSDDIMKSLNGDISGKISNGKIANSLIFKRISGVLEKFIKLDDISFRDLSATLRIADQKVYFDEMKMNSDLAGDWAAIGSVGFDASLDMNVNTRLTRAASDKAVSLQNSGKSALKNLLQGTQFGAAANLLDNAGIPVDAENRITLKLGLGGTVTDPKVSFNGFGEGGGAAATQSQQTSSVKEQVVNKVQNAVNENKDKIESKVSEEANKIEDQIIKKTGVSKQQADKLKNDALKKLKKFF